MEPMQELTYHWNCRACALTEEERYLVMLAVRVAAPMAAPEIKRGRGRPWRRG
jgi:hypothetical protein